MKKIISAVSAAVLALTGTALFADKPAKAEDNKIKIICLVQKYSYPFWNL